MEKENNALPDIISAMWDEFHDHLNKEYEKELERQVLYRAELIACKLDGGCDEALLGPECPELFEKTEDVAHTVIQQLGISARDTFLRYGEKWKERHIPFVSKPNYEPSYEIRIRLPRVKQIPTNEQLKQIDALCKEIFDILAPERDGSKKD